MHDFRWFIDLVEAKMFLTPTPYGEVRVWETPNENTLKHLLAQFGELRGLAVDDHYWIWNSSDGTHHMVGSGLGLDSDGSDFLIARRGKPLTASEWQGLPTGHNATMTLYFDGSDDDIPSRLAAIFHEYPVGERVEHADQGA